MMRLSQVVRNNFCGSHAGKQVNRGRGANSSASWWPTSHNVFFPGGPIRTNDDKDQRNDFISCNRLSCRSYHSTPTKNIAPFLPELIIAGGIIGGWAMHRVSQGKPLTPDGAIEAQEAYKRQEQELQRRQKQYFQQRQTKSTGEKRTHVEGRGDELRA